MCYVAREYGWYCRIVVRSSSRESSRGEVNGPVAAARCFPPVKNAAHRYGWSQQPVGRSMFTRAKGGSTASLVGRFTGQRAAPRCRVSPPSAEQPFEIIATYIGLRVQKYQNIRVARKSIASYLRRVLPLCFSCALLFVAWPCYNVLELIIQPARGGASFPPPPFGTIVRSTAPRARLLLICCCAARFHSSLSLPNHEMSHDIHRWYCPG